MKVRHFFKQGLFTASKFKSLSSLLYALDLARSANATLHTFQQRYIISETTLHK